MYQTSESEDEYKEAIYSAEDLNSKQGGCSHHFVREGQQVKCVKCHIGYFDLDHSFPITELNSYYQDPQNRAYEAKKA